MQGKRISEPLSGIPNPGEYWQRDDGSWYGMTPNELLANLSGHTVEEHLDRAITVVPSILVSGGSDGLQWHGYLTDGVWKEC